MAPPREPLGPLERSVLSYITDHHPVTVRDVAAQFEKTTGQARTTVLTVMQRLRTKGYLERRKSAGIHQYVPTITKPALLAQMVDEFVENVLEGSVSPFVAYLTRSSQLSADELARLTKLVERLESRKRKERS